MKTPTTYQPPQPETPKKSFLGGLFERIDQALKSAAEKKTPQSCCCSDGSKESGSGKGGKCC